MSDLIITNARVYTVDTANPHAEAVVVQGKRIAFVGTTADALAHRQPHSRVVDGHGRTLLPGFIDSHFHLLWGALSMGDAQLDEVRSLEELAAAIRAYEVENHDLAWLVGRGLRYVVPSHDEALTRHHLDEIEAERPFFISAYDYHTIWANTAALRLAGLLHGAETPAGSSIVMGADGLATGELREPGAYEPLLALKPRPDEGHPTPPLAPRPCVVRRVGHHQCA
jgi:predicted amidohydrolase YtcJ